MCRTIFQDTCTPTHRKSEMINNARVIEVSACFFGLRTRACRRKIRKRKQEENQRNTYKDPTRRREYDEAYKQKQRATGLTKKGIDTRLTAIEIKTAEDLPDLSNEVVAEVQNADSSSFELEPKLRIKLRAVEIGLRVIEISRFPRLSRNRLRRAHLRSEKQVLMPGSSTISEPFFAHSHSPLTRLLPDRGSASLFIASELIC